MEAGHDCAPTRLSPASGASPVALLALQQALVSPIIEPAFLDEPGVRSIIRTLGQSAFGDLLVAHGLAPLWFERVAALRPDFLDPPLLARLKAQRIAHLAAGAKKADLAQRLQASLRDVGIASVVFKGTHLGATLYPDPGLRPGVDVDIIVSLGSRKDAIKTLAALGARFAPHADTLGQQVACRLDGVEIDLHWRFVRRGRSRGELADFMLERPVTAGGLIVPNDTATLLAMLTHPLLSTRPGAPDAKLIRLLDLYFWFAARGDTLERIADRLNESGTGYTAWLMMEWLRRTCPGCVDVVLPSSMTPSLRRRRWLRRWLPDTAPGIAHSDALSVQIGYRSALHVNVADALREHLQLVRERLAARSRMTGFRATLARSAPAQQS